jgi:hypothetical protein
MNQQSHTYEVITIAALLFGPFFALLAQRGLDWLRERDKQQKELYSELMRTRLYVFSVEHFQALNSIDLVFAKDQDILDLWKACRDHLLTDETQPGWQERLDTLRYDLYQAIGNKLGFSYTTEYLKRGLYVPIRHTTHLENQEKTMAGLAKALAGGVVKVKLEDSTQVPTIAGGSAVAGRNATPPTAGGGAGPGRNATKYSDNK